MLQRNQSKPTHWLLDVDDTLLTVEDSGCIFNMALIEYLAQNKVNQVSFLTKMDAKSMSFNSPLRVEVITKLREYGIEVEQVITPLDVLYQKTTPQNKEFLVGDVYKKCMRPVEESLVAIKKLEINSQIFNEQEVYYNKKLRLQALEYLTEAKLVESNTTLANWMVNKQFLKEVDTHILSAKNHDLQQVDFAVISDHLLPNIKFELKNNPTMTVDELKKKFQFELESEKQKLLTAQQTSAMELFFALRLEYRNQNYLRNLQASRTVEYTKGEAYQLWAESKLVSETDAIIFIDDNKKEHDSVNGVHLACNMRADLKTLLPPTNDLSAFRFCTPLELFQFKLSSVVMGDLKYEINLLKKTNPRLNDEKAAEQTPLLEQNKDAFVGALETLQTDLKNEQNILHGFGMPHAQLLNSPAEKIAKAASTLLMELRTNTSIEKKLLAIKTFEDKCKPSRYRIFMKAVAVVISAAVGFVLGAIIGMSLGIAVGSWSGPGAVMTGLIGAFKGSATGASIGLAIGSSLTGVVAGGISANYLFKPKQRDVQIKNVIDSARVNVSLNKVS